MSDIAQATLTATSLRESLASGRDAFKVGPIRACGQYHGRLLTGFTNSDLAAHAAHILASCDRYDTTLTANGAVAVIARKP
jgi:hypothetical protein